MTLIIVIILLMGYFLIATGHLTNINKAAIAMFVCTVGWILYISYGTDFVMGRHQHEYMEFLDGRQPSSAMVKYYISDHIFLKYLGNTASIVLFLLATMSIIEILNNNGCFDFISEWVRTRSSRRFVWTITLFTFVISANLDNLTTATMMLTIMHNIVQSRRQRLVIGCAIVLAANTGGCFTVIGDPAGVALWTNGAVTASNFSAYLFLPAVIAWVVPTYLLSRNLPDRLDVEWPAARYRGDDTNLSRWQRLVMLVVGIGGLWFIPTFHNITKLGPFLGALCVLSVLWVVDEVVNRKLINSGRMIQRRMPQALQYGNIQSMLFIIGIMLGMGAVSETGIFSIISEWLDYNVHNVWIYGVVAGLLSGIVDMFTIAMTGISMYPVLDSGNIAIWSDAAYMSGFVANGAYWKIIAYSTAVGGSLVCFANVSGLALMKMESMRIGWYVKHCTSKILLGWLVGLAVLWMEINFMNIM
ncbi:MAG: sodium:proton antiporter [Prevotella sp.]|nr:sodium:proton antiporter [Prevotella sp.]